MGRRGDKVGQKLRRLQAFTDSALSGLDVDDLLTELLERTREVLSADTAAVLLLDATGADLVATAVAGVVGDAQIGARYPLGEGFAGRIAANGEPMTVDRAQPDPALIGFLHEQDLSTVVGVPMVANGRIVGVLHVGSRRERTFTDDDIELLQLVADRAGLAAQVRLSQMDRVATLSLQRSLLPSRPAPIAGLDIAARYIPGGQSGVGGDWYDAFALPSGHSGLVIGDVAGNGLRAAVVMGRIRSALRAYALESDDPADVLRRLDRKIQLFEPGAIATAIYAVIDPSHEKMVYSVAGHLPPIRIQPGGVTLFPVHADPPLGAFPDVQRHSSCIDLTPGTGFVMYTDGLVERREHLISEGIHELQTALTATTAAELCREAVGVLRQRTATDDVAVLAAMRTTNTLADGG